MVDHASIGRLQSMGNQMYLKSKIGVRLRQLAAERPQKKDGKKKERNFAIVLLAGVMVGK